MARAPVRLTATTSSAFLSRSPFFLTRPLSLFSRSPLHFRCQSSSSHQSLSSSPACSTSSRQSRVSIGPAEQAPTPVFDFEKEIVRLHALRTRISRANTIREKLRLLDSDDGVRDFFGSVLALPSLGLREEFLVKCLVAAGQGHVLGRELHNGCDKGGNHVAGTGLKAAFYKLANMIEMWNMDGVGVEVGQEDEWSCAVSEPLKKLLKTLDEVEAFYDCIGGIIGYQAVVLELLSPLQSKGKFNRFSHLNVYLKSQIQKLHVPAGANLFENAEYASQAALWGLEGLPELGEIYPLGGAGDRLGLVDSITGECLPAAMLQYCGRTLLEGLIRDLQAREFLHFKVFGEKCITPVAIMTSSVKNNHEHIFALCEKHGWFGRGKEKFQLFEQPMVPVVAAEDGQWLINEPLSLVCKPGGHGAIWKLAHDKGIFQWFYSHGRKGATVRQVSNVVAATDVTLLALAGVGLKHKKKLGFVSCQRNFGATEGINVLVEKQSEDGQWTYGLTCIEYTEFDKYDIKDVPVSLGSSQEGFPANTNILYVDLRAAESIGASECWNCLPGLVLNLKKPVDVYHHGIKYSVSGCRLECTMQNIADNFFNTYTYRCNEGVEDILDTFILYNERKRVTSSAKRKRKRTDKSLHQTPDGSFLDVLRNASDLLSKCNISIPKIAGNSKYVNSGPPFIILLHPALGPLWEITRQKFFGGSISVGSELQVEVAEFSWRDVHLNGSLIIVAENIMGSTRTNGLGEPILHYGHRCGRCRLNNVKVVNRGIDWLSAQNVYWKQDIKRFEMLKVLLHGNAEFEAINVVLEGNHVFQVPDGYRMHVISSSAGFDVKLEPKEDEVMETGSWFWEYKLSGSHIQLKQKTNRKLVHISVGLVFMLFWPLFSPGHLAPFLAALAPGVNIIRMLLLGLGIWKNEAMIKSMSRQGDCRELLKGPLYYACTITFSTLIFWRTSPVAIAAICNLCAGDGVADIVGRRFGEQKLPYNPNKSYAGTIAMAVAGFLSSLGYMYYFASFGFIEESWSMILGFLLVSVAAAIVESLQLSTELDDNLTVPLTSLLVGAVVF